MTWSNASVFFNLEEKKFGRGKKRKTATDSPDAKVWMLEYLITTVLEVIMFLFILHKPCTTNYG